MLNSGRFFIGRGGSSAAAGPIHTYALYEAFGIPRRLWLIAVTLQVAADDAERAAITRYLSKS
jgi:hypothetical protein